MEDDHANRTLTDEEIRELEMAQSQEEWDATCDKIKAPDGVYPRDWFQRIIQSGMLTEISRTW